MKNTKFYQKQWFMWVALFLFAPVGIFLLWKYNRYSQVARIAISCIFGLVFLVVLGSSKNDNETNTADTLQTKATVESTQAVKKEAKKEITVKKMDTPTPKPTPKSTPTPTPEPIILGNGNFIAGKDFPAGTYDIIAVKGGGNVSSSNQFRGGINAIMGTKGDFYEKEYKNIELPTGEKLKIDRVTIKLIYK